MAAQGPVFALHGCRSGGERRLVEAATGRPFDYTSTSKHKNDLYRRVSGAEKFQGARVRGCARRWCTTVTMPDRDEALAILGDEFVSVFEEIKGFSCEDVFRLFGFMWDAAKQPNSTSSGAPPRQELAHEQLRSPGTKKKRSPANSDEQAASTAAATAAATATAVAADDDSVPVMVTLGVVLPAHIVNKTADEDAAINLEYVKQIFVAIQAFNGGSILQYMKLLKSWLAADCGTRFLSRPEVLRGRIVMILMAALLYYTYPDGILELESYAFLSDEECRSHGIAPTRGCRVSLKFSGTSVSRRPMHDLVAHVGEKSVRMKLTSVVARCKERRLYSPGAGAGAGVSSSEEVSGGETVAAPERERVSDEDVTDSAKCYAELFLRAAEMAAFGCKKVSSANDSGDADDGFDFGPPSLEAAPTEIVFGFNEQGQVDLILTNPPRDR